MTRRQWHLILFVVADSAALVLFVFGSTEGIVPILAAVLLLIGAVVALVAPPRAPK